MITNNMMPDGPLDARLPPLYSKSLLCCAECHVGGPDAARGRARTAHTVRRPGAGTTCTLLRQAVAVGREKIVAPFLSLLGAFCFLRGISASVNTQEKLRQKERLYESQAVRNRGARRRKT